MALVMFGGVALDAGDVGSVAPCGTHEEERRCVVVTMKETRPDGYNAAKSQTWHIPGTDVATVAAAVNAALGVPAAPAGD